MNAKEYLGSVYAIDLKINAKLSQVANLRMLLTRTSVTFSDMPGNPNHDRSRMEEVMVKIIDMENEINDDIDELVDMKSRIKAAIDGIDDPLCQAVLELRYMSFKSWDEIADTMDCSLRRVHYLHSRGLEMVNVSEAA